MRGGHVKRNAYMIEEGRAAKLRTRQTGTASPLFVTISVSLKSHGRRPLQPLEGSKKVRWGERAILLKEQFGGRTDADLIAGALVGFRTFDKVLAMPLPKIP